MAINSADIMTHTVTALKAQLDIDDFVHPDEKIHSIIEPLYSPSEAY